MQFAIKSPGARTAAVIGQQAGARECRCRFIQRQDFHGSSRRWAVLATVVLIHTDYCLLLGTGADSAQFSKYRPRRVLRIKITPSRAWWRRKVRVPARKQLGKKLRVFVPDMAHEVTAHGWLAPFDRLKDDPRRG